MKVRIHRGANQIGGCITEIQSASGTRILIDLGHNLPGESKDDIDRFDDRENSTFRKWVSYLMLLLNPEETILVYSQYAGYLKEQPKLQEFVKLFGENTAYVHTSGHATRKTLAKICNILNPSTAIIPIHKDSSSKFIDLGITPELKKKVVETTSDVNGVLIEID